MADRFTPSISYDVAINATPTSTAAAQAISPCITTVRLACTQPCYVTFGFGTPVATKPGGMRLNAAYPEYFGCVPGQTVAVINDGTTAGVLTITEMNG